MARRRFFVDSVRNGRAEIEGDNAHHLTRVLRVEAGQKYEITDSERVWLAEVSAARKSLVQFEVIQELAAGPEPAETTLCLALIKFERLEWAIEKATELGVTRIVPVETLRSEHGLFDGARKRVERWRRIAREASEQSRRMRAPEISDPIRFKQVARPPALGIWLDEQPGAPPLANLLQASSREAVTLIIGPEGGWAETEREYFSTSGWRGASLGPMILRAETAACAALAVVAQGRMESAALQSKQPDAAG